MAIGRVSNDLSGMERLYDGGGRYWTKGEAEGRLAGKEMQCRVREFELDSDVRIPTSRRVVTEIGQNLDERADEQREVLMLPGFCHLDIQFYGDLIECLARVLQGRGALGGTKFVGVNCCGKGTEEYMNRRDRISAITATAEIEDAKKIVVALKRMGIIGEDIDLLPHSMGHLNAMAILDLLSSEDLEVEDILGGTGVQVHNVFDFMPATDRKFGLFRLKHLMAIRNSIPRALLQAVTGQGNVDIDSYDWQKIMFAEGRFRDTSHYLYRVPDSARRFLQIFLNGFGYDLGKKFGDLMRRRGKVERTTINVFQGRQDQLIPDSMPQEFFDRIGETKGGPRPGTIYDGTNHYHALPFRMTQAQRDQVMQFLDLALEKEYN